MPEIQKLTAESAVIEANVLRLFGSFLKAAELTGISRTLIWKMIQDGEITDSAAGKLYKVGIDPAELVRPIEEKRA
jgi:hypothetical protein